MAKKTTKFWALNPQNLEDKKLLASFEVNGDKVKSDLRSAEFKDLAKRGLHTRQGKLTLEENGPEFVELLAANYGMSSFIEVEID